MSVEELRSLFSSDEFQAVEDYYETHETESENRKDD